MLARSRTESLQIEINKLEKWLETWPFHPFYNEVQRIHRKLRTRYRHSPYQHDYLQDAIAVNAVLASPHDEAALNNLITRAEKTIGSAIPERKVMGACLMALGIGLLVLSMLLLTATVACSFPLAGFFMLLSGTANVAHGVGLFRSGLQRGMAKEIAKLTALKDSLGLPACTDTTVTRAPLTDVRGSVQNK